MEVFIYAIIVFGFLHNQVGPLPGTYTTLQACQLALTQQRFDVGYWGKCEAVAIMPTPAPAPVPPAAKGAE